MIPLLSTPAALADTLLPAFEGALRGGLALSGAAGSRLLGFASDHVLALGAVGGGLFLLSEVLARQSARQPGPASPEAARIASRLGIAPDALAPIGDGIQLWRDASAAVSGQSRRRGLGRRAFVAQDHGAQDLGSASDTVPPGAPTLVLSALALTPSGLCLVALHDLDLPGLRLSPDSPGVASAPVSAWDAFTGTFLKRRIDFSVDDDAARRAFLLERIAGARFGKDFAGRIRPLVLTMRRPGSALPTDALREGLPLAAGRTVPHVDIADAGAIARAISGATSDGASDAKPGATPDRVPATTATTNQEAFALLSALLASQNARMTPRRRVARRAAVAAACAALWVQQGPGITPEAVSPGLAAAKARVSAAATMTATQTAGRSTGGVASPPAPSPAAPAQIRPLPRP